MLADIGHLYRSSIPRSHEAIPWKWYNCASLSRMDYRNCPFCLVVHTHYTNRDERFPRLSLEDHPDYDNQPIYNQVDGDLPVFTRLILTGPHLIVASWTDKRHWTVLLEFQLYAEGADVLSFPTAATEVSENPASSKSLQLAQNCLRNCLENHIECRDLEAAPIGVVSSQSLISQLKALAFRGSRPAAVPVPKTPQFLPTRLIDVGPSDGTEPPKLIFTRSETVPGSPPKVWIALSHRWGGSSSAVTKRANLNQMMKEICVADLPKSFRDAITLTRRLGQRYLWIDSMCIVQDEPEDWRREFPRMGDIYERSLLTIAAHNARGSDEGFLRERPQRELLPLMVFSTRTPVGDRKVYIRLPLANWETAVDGPASSLSDRGWVLQEAMMSPRTLNYCADNVFWQCRTMIHSEGYRSAMSYADMRRAATASPSAESFSRPHNQKTLLVRLSTMSISDACAAWRDLVEHYSTRALTKPEDRLPAIDGIAARFRMKLDCRYISGVFERDIHRSLLWRTYRGVHHCGQRVDRLPSWSWASSDASVRWDKPGALDRLEERADVTFAGPATEAQQAAAVTGAEMAVQRGAGDTDTPLSIRGLWRHSADLGPADVLATVLMLRSPDHGVVICDFDSMDFGDNWARSKSRDFGVVTVLWTRNARELVIAYCIIVEEVQGSPGTWRRIGAALVEGLSRLNTVASGLVNWEERTVCVV